MQKVLVVDDEQLVADTLRLIFRHHGFDARVAYSGEEALSSARDFHPELLCCDITMPGKGGLELMNDITRELPDCRILILTGHYSNLPNVRQVAARLPRRASVLVKPCNPLELLREAGAMLATA
jgi:CheY-like chemotaxis protein